MVTYSEARQRCFFKGYLLWLPKSQAEIDSVFQTLLERSINSIWMPLKRMELTDYLWIDNKRHSKSDWNKFAIFMTSKTNVSFAHNMTLGSK